MEHHDYRTQPLDRAGNFVAHHNTLPVSATIVFEGRNNRMVIDGQTEVDAVDARFTGNNGQLVIGSVSGPLNLDVSIAENASVEIGDHVTSEATLSIRTVPGARVRIGSGCLFRAGVSVDADAASALGASADDEVSIGQNVLVTGADVQVRAGASVGDGAILELTPLIDHEVSAGALVRGVPATEVRAAQWDRDNLPKTSF